MAFMPFEIEFRSSAIQDAGDLALGMIVKAHLKRRDAEHGPWPLSTTYTRVSLMSR
jgi:hypothetical protein